jgi:hypothetical protein
VPSCQDLISGMMKEADEIISKRLKAFAA